MSDNRRTELPKRFYTTVSVEPDAGGHGVRLDGRAVRTPGRRALVVPSASVAQAIAAEWDRQGQRIDPATMPVTRLVNTTIDGILDDPSAVRAELKRYAETDLLFYRADAPEALVARQAENWDPVLRWAEAHVGGLFLTATGVMHVAQPAKTLAAVGRRLDREDDAFVLAALHQMTTLTGSLLLAVAVREGRLEAGTAWALAHVDEDWNIEQWGADEEAAARREARWQDMNAAAQLATP